MTKGIWLVCKVDGERLPITYKELKFLIEHAYGHKISELFKIEIAKDYKYFMKAINLCLDNGVHFRSVWEDGRERVVSLY